MGAAFSELREALEERGWRIGLVSLSRLDSIRASIDRSLDVGEFESAFYEKEISTRFDWEPPEGHGEIASVIVIGRPADAHFVRFETEEQTFRLIAPPTYLHYSHANAEMLEAAQAALSASGYCVLPARLPDKALAVSAGIARWGRNNIAYLPGMGSFAQLAAGWTDLPSTGLSDPAAATVLDRCARCVACIKACPTGAIDEGRFLLHGERCLTHVNEWEGEFPEWVPLTAHNALVGCMRCQLVCPENIALRPTPVDSGIAFDAEETSSLLAETPLDGLGGSTREKIEALDILIDYELICRNLRALMAAVGR